MTVEVLPPLGPQGLRKRAREHLLHPVEGAVERGLFKSSNLGQGHSQPPTEPREKAPISLPSFFSISFQDSLMVKSILVKDKEASGFILSSQTTGQQATRWRVDLERPIDELVLSS